MNYRFNLQPWREAIRQKQKKKFNTITGVVFIISIFLIGLNYYIEKNYADEQGKTIKYLEDQIVLLQAAQKKVDDIKLFINEINKQIEAIELLRSQRGMVLKILDYIAANTPSEVFLENMAFDGAKLKIKGVAENDIGVANFMRMLQDNQLFASVVLDGEGIQVAESTNRYQVNPKSETKSFAVSARLKIYEGEADEVY